MYGLDKRQIIRDQRDANLGLLRRVVLRIRTVREPQSVAGVDPLANAAPDKSTDKLMKVTARYVNSKSAESEGDTGRTQTNSATLWIHPMFKPYFDQCYEMYVGGTGKNWEKSGPVEFDDSRSQCHVPIVAV